MMVKQYRNILKSTSGYKIIMLIVFAVHQMQSYIDFNQIVHFLVIILQGENENVVMI